MDGSPRTVNLSEDKKRWSDRAGIEDCDDSNVANSFLLEFDDRAVGHLVNFYEPEMVNGQFFRWSEPVAMVRLDVPPSDYEITVETGLLRCGTCDFPFKIFWNDQQLERGNIQIEEGRIKFSVSRTTFIRNDEQRLTFSCKPLNAEKGRRQLGIPIQWIRMDETGSRRLEFANPTRTRSRLWRGGKSLLNVRRLLGLKFPSTNLPIWEMKLPGATTSLVNAAKRSRDPRPASDFVVVSSVEINSRHGTGLLIQYMFEDFTNLTTVSSQRCFHGDRVRSANHFEVPSKDLKRHEIYELVLKWFKDAPPKRAFVVPYFKTELLVAIAMSDLFGTEICLHIMDDQCLYEDEISFELMDEALQKSGLTFVISPEMQDAYERRFARRVYILPPVVPEGMIRNEYQKVAEVNGQPESKKRLGDWLGKLTGRETQTNKSGRGILIGNIWDERWLQKLQVTIRDSGYEIDWYSNNPDAVLLGSRKDQLRASGIHLQNPLWGQELVDELRRRPFAIMPSGMLGKDELKESLARLSLPSRIPFVMSVSNIPIIVLGSTETAAAKFVRRFDIGLVSDYDPQPFKVAVDTLLQVENQNSIRQRAAQLSSVFSARGMYGWLSDSIRQKLPADTRFEDVFSDTTGSEESTTVSQDAAERIRWDRERQWTMLRRLQNRGYAPNRVIDVGAGDGAWSWSTSQIFPDAQFVLIEPLLALYSQQDREKFKNSLGCCEVLEHVLSNCKGDTEFERASVGRQPVGTGGMVSSKQAEQSRTLDSLARDRAWTGTTLLKIDAQEAESIVLAGGVDFIKTEVDVVMVTVNVAPLQLQSKNHVEILSLMNSLGFHVIDEMEAQRCPQTEMLLRKHVVFMKQKLAHDQMAA